MKNDLIDWPSADQMARNTRDRVSTIRSLSSMACRTGGLEACKIKAREEIAISAMEAEKILGAMESAMDHARRVQARISGPACAGEPRLRAIVGLQAWLRCVRACEEQAAEKLSKVQRLMLAFDD